MLDIFAISVEGLYHLKRLILQYVIINVSNIVTIINAVIINWASCLLEQPSEIQYSLESCLGTRQKTSSTSLRKCVVWVRVPKGQ